MLERQLLRFLGHTDYLSTTWRIQMQLIYLCVKMEEYYELLGGHDNLKNGSLLKLTVGKMFSQWLKD